MNTTNRALIGFSLFIILLGLYAWFDRARTLECRQTSQQGGASVSDAVQLCKR